MNAAIQMSIEDRSKIIPNFINPIIMIWIVVFIMFTMWIYLLIKSLHDNKSKKKLIIFPIVMVISFAICYFLMYIHQYDLAPLVCMMPALSLIFLDNFHKEE